MRRPWKSFSLYSPDHKFFSTTPIFVDPLRLGFPSVFFGKDLLEKWETASRRLIQQNDGMVSLWQINDVLKQSSHIEQLNTSLWGIGGEIARGFYSNARLFLGRPGYGMEDVQKFLTAKIINSNGGLIEPEAIALTKAYLQNFLTQYTDEGFAPFDLLDIFYTYERVRRWAGTNARKAEPNGSLFAPLCTRPFVKAAFVISAMARYTEPLHYQLTKLLVPELHRLPFEKEPWRIQHPVFNVLNEIWKARLAKIGYSQATKSVPMPLAFDRAEWLEANKMQLLSELRELCLDQSDSLMWNFVNRSRFEHITSLDSKQAKLRQKHIAGIYNIATLFYYALST